MDTTANIKGKLAEDYWLQRLRNAGESAGSNGCFRYEHHSTFAEVQQDLPATIVAAMNRMFTGASHATGKFLLYQLALKILCYKYSGNSDVVLVTSGPGGEGPVFLRSQLQSGEALKSLLLQEQTALAAALQHQHFDYKRLFQKLELNQLADEKYLLQLSLYDESFNTHHPLLDQCSIQVALLQQGSVKLRYATALFKPAAAKDFMESYLAVLQYLTSHTGTTIAGVEILSDRQRAVIQQYSSPEAVFEIRETVLEKFAVQATKTPVHPALVAGDTTLTYQQLAERSDAVAWHLHHHWQVGAGDIVALMLGRSEQLGVITLGILKTGAAYVAIDPQYPDDRKQFILQNSKCRVLITEEEYNASLSQWDGIVACTDIFPQQAAGTLPERRIHPDDPAFVIYTSGSTGQPKGILQTHRCLYNVVMRQVDHGGFEKGLRVLQYASSGFDVFIAHELFFALLSGGSLFFITAEQQKDLSLLGKFIADHAIEWLLLPVSALNTIVEVSDELHFGNISLKHIVSAGEQLNLGKALMRYLEKNPRIRLHNFYGPSETHNASNYTVPDGELLDREQPVGRPAANTWIYILSADGQPVPAGIPGEMYIGGAGLALGYIGQPELTAEKFLPDPFRPGSNMYKTGDLGKWLPDGNIAFLGRIDEQVKIRGNRVEPGEVENALLKHPLVNQCAVITFETDGVKELAAYLAASTSVDAASLRAFLLERLPEYMVPGYFVQLNKLPLNANGKIDRKKLAEIIPSGTAVAAPYIAPRNTTEVALAAIWSELLERQQISIKDNFFTLGGHSLKATRLASRIHKQFHVRLSLNELFSNVVLEDQAALILQARKQAYEAIPAAGERPYYPLSSAQQRLWLVSQFNDVHAAYHIPAVYQLEGPLDSLALEQALLLLSSRHEILRTVFREDETGTVRQFVLPPGEAGIRLAQVGLLPDMEQHVQQLIAEPFDLGAGPLLRAGLYRQSDGTYIFCWVLHHIIADGWTMDILMEELLASYVACSNGRVPEWPALGIQYKDYAVWQQAALADTMYSHHRSYWRRQLENLPVLALPADKARPAVKTYNGKTVSIRLEAALTRQLEALCLLQQATLFMGLLATVNALLYRYTGEQDLIVGTPVAGRLHADLEKQAGLFLNTLALRVTFPENSSYHELLSKARAVTLDAYAHQEYPFETLVNDLSLPHDMSRHPLFEVWVALQNTGNGFQETLAAGPLRVSGYDAVADQTSKFDLSFTFASLEDGLVAAITYNTDLFHDSTINRLAGHFRQLLQAMIAAPDTPISQLEYLSEAEKYQLLHTFNTAAERPAAAVPVPVLFQHAAASYAGQTALIYGEQHISYQQLKEQAGSMAAYLQQTVHIAAGDRVAIQLERSADAVIAMLAILFAGAAYLPVDTGYQQERIDYMLHDSQCKLVINDAWLQHYRAQEPLVAVPPAAVLPGNTAYVIYTSGSTGMPKGCEITHANLASYIGWANRYYFGNSGPVSFGLFTSLSFDLTVTSIFCTLTQGGCLTIAPPEEELTDTLAWQFHAESGINSIKLTPSHINLLQQLDIRSGSMLNAIVGGEELTTTQINILKDINPDIRIYNEYGPTEATVGCIVQPIASAQQPVTIGAPIDAAAIYILDGAQGLVPVGVAGEIYIAGAGVAKGYIGRQALTAEKFLDCPFGLYPRMYRTGDLAQWNADGVITYLGRKDEQLKIRGYRIESGEIENALRSHPQVAAALVIARTDAAGNKELVAYLVCEEALHTAAIREYLRTRLPAYMVPAYFVSVKDFPLTRNGKVNRAQLPDPLSAALSTGLVYTAPRNDVEEKLVNIWEEVLGREKIGVKDNFFELGGHSLKAGQLLTRINMTFHVRLHIRDVFNEPTIEHIAEQIGFMMQQKEQQQNKEALIQIDI
ncbi:non-ribosomal peptide synthetase [Chitinophaga sp. Cy-1792]|uniref:non-ribosomal peptide synthetase n=1 Tax=Chitinophaga sp. Cy-1792 TaxID=2608339 RepID=UPI001424A7DE|nr:non-ribosomal peptide synthetase [Chitinophaga sp. Cy-1792]